MRDRVFLKTEFTPAGVGGQGLRRDVGGFLRYIQHRDQHASSPTKDSRSEVAGLMKYVAYRDRASIRADLFGPSGTSGTAERKAFTRFVVAALENSRPQLFRGRDGEMHDRRRAVHRMILSPERAAGLDLRQVMLAGTALLERECGGRLQWLAAIHRNTAHHHIHFVLAGMRQDETGRFVRVEITKRRLAALKQAVELEVVRQRGERAPAIAVQAAPSTSVGDPKQETGSVPASTLASLPSQGEPRRPRVHWQRFRRSPHAVLVLALRTVARRYQRRMQRELEDDYRRSQLEHAA
jgi:relaxase-like protein